MNRVSIVVDKSLGAGQKVNVASIIMGQLSLMNPEIYTGPVKDMESVVHSGISVNVVILDASNNQLATLVKNHGNVKLVVFSRIGQELSYSYDEYKDTVSKSDTLSTQIVGAGLYGDFEIIKSLTKKLSLTK